jgi:hypothetical protein
MASAARAIMATRVAAINGHKGNGNSEGDNVGNGDDNKASRGWRGQGQGRQWQWQWVVRVVGDKEGNDGDGGKRDGNGNKGGRWATAMATKRVMVPVTRMGGKQQQWQ